MPKSRKKKVKHQDFAKVKLKVGKKLPKAANETDASFRSRSIQVKDQFKSTSEADKSLLINKKKIYLKDILSQCQHYNPGNKYDALKKLHEAVHALPNIIDNNLADILERCSELFVDKDPVIRSAAFKILKLVFARTSPTHITPFFPVVSAYMCCAMTHLNEEIQLDSLKILDIALEHYPELVITSSSSLLPNLLEQISRQQTADGVSGRNNEGSRILAVNPSGIRGSTRWRTDVLRRLRRVLEAFLSVKREGLIPDRKGDDGEDVKWQAVKSHMTLKQYPVWYTHNYIIQSPGIIGASGVDSLASGQSLQSYLQSLIPLLLQCWVEVGPAQLASSLPGNALSQGALLVLSNILAIFDLILKYISTFLDDDSLSVEWLRQTYLKDFIHYFMDYFPFAMHEQKSTSKEKKTPEWEKVSVLSLNLAVCQVMTYFLDVNSTRAKWLEKIILFMTSQLEHCKLSTEELKLSLDVYSQLLQNVAEKYIKSELLKAALHIYMTKHAKSADLEMMFTFFMNAFFHDENKEIRSLPVFTQWQETFPRLLADKSGNKETIVTLVLTTIKSCLIHKEPLFSVNILDTCQLLDVHFVSNLTSAQQCLLAEIIFNFPGLQRSHFKSLAGLFLNDILNMDVQFYLLRILGQRICLENVNEIFLASYLSFMFTLLLRRPKDEMVTELQQFKEASHCDLAIIYSEDDASEWCKKHSRVECVLEELQSLELPEDIVGQIWISFVTRMTSAIQHLSIQSAIAIVLTTSVLVSNMAIPDSFLALVTLIILRSLDHIAESVKTGKVKADLSANVISSELSTSILFGSLLCIKKTRGLWCCILDKVRDRVEEGTTVQEVLAILTILQPLCTADVLRDQMLLHREKLTDLLDYLMAKHPQIKSGHLYGDIMYHLSVEAKQSMMSLK